MKSNPQWQTICQSLITLSSMSKMQIFSQEISCLPLSSDGMHGIDREQMEDFYVSCKQEFHCKRVYFDADFFSNMLDKLN